MSADSLSQRHSLPHQEENETATPPAGPPVHQGAEGPGALGGCSVLPQRLLQSVAIRLIAADHRLSLLVLLLVQDPQEVAQLWDGEGIPLGKKLNSFNKFNQSL